jgi:hypothetical protein
MKIKTSTLKEQRLAGELGLIIDHMGHAMWNAHKEYIAANESPLTPDMNAALCEFHEYCVRNYGKKS